MNKVSMMEVMALSVTVVVSTAVLFTPYLTAVAAGKDAWISVLVAGVLAAIPTWATGLVMSRFPKQSIIQAMPALFGVILGKFVSILFSGYFLFAGVLAIWRLEAFTVRFLLPETPLMAVRILFLIGIAYATFSGSIPLLRTNAYIMPLGIFVVVLVTALPSSKMDLSFLLPVFEFGYRPMIDGAVLLLGWLCQVPLVIMMYYRYVEPKFLHQRSKKAILGVLLAALAMEMGALGTLAAFGPEQTASLFYPSFALARVISVGAFVEHIEVIFIAVWIASIFISTTFYIQSFCDSVSDIVTLKGKTAKVLLISGTIIALAIWPMFVQASFFVLIYSIKDFASWAAILLGGAFPLLMLARIVISPPNQSSQTNEESGSESQIDIGNQGDKGE